MDLRLRISGSIWRLAETCAETASTEDHHRAGSPRGSTADLRNLWVLLSLKSHEPSLGSERTPGTPLAHLLSKLDKRDGTEEGMDVTMDLGEEDEHS